MVIFYFWAILCISASFVTLVGLSIYGARGGGGGSRTASPNRKRFHIFGTFLFNYKLVFFLFLPPLHRKIRVCVLCKAVSRGSGVGGLKPPVNSLRLYRNAYKQVFDAFLNLLYPPPPSQQKYEYGSGSLLGLFMLIRQGLFWLLI